MTPKEKAEGLYRKVENSIYLAQYTSEATKECALIAVNEIIDLLEDEGITFAEYHDRTTIEYWLEAKQELDKLGFNFKIKK